MENIERSKVLIVDDLPQNLVAMETLLKPLGAEVIRANSGHEALGLVLRHQFAVILLDVQMPDMDGFETSELIHQLDECQNLPVIFVTAIDKDQHYATQGYETGAVDYLSKPIEPMRLRAKVRVFLDLDQQKKKLGGLLDKKEELLGLVDEQNAQKDELFKKVENKNRENEDLVSKLNKQNKGLRAQRKLAYAAGLMGLISIGFAVSDYLMSAENTRLNDQNAQVTKLKDAYKRFIPHEIMGILERDSIENVELGDQVLRAMPVMFFDVVGFTSISEDLSPQETIALMNKIFSAVQPEIKKHNGIVNKYLGDGAMVIFPRSEDDAVKAGLAMVKAVAKLSDERIANGLVPLKLGIGISSGPVMVGTVGEKDRMEYTVYGNTVNLASRIEGLTRKYGAYFLINEDVYSRLTGLSRANMRMVDRVVVKGKLSSTTIYEAYGEQSKNRKALLNGTKKDYEKALVLYQNGKIKKALALFRKVLRVNDADSVVRFHVAKCGEQLAAGKRKNWSAIQRFAKK